MEEEEIIDAFPLKGPSETKGLYGGTKDTYSLGGKSVAVIQYKRGNNYADTLNKLNKIGYKVILIVTVKEANFTNYSDVFDKMRDLISKLEFSPRILILNSDRVYNYLEQLYTRGQSAAAYLWVRYIDNSSAFLYPGDKYNKLQVYIDESVPYNVWNIADLKLPSPASFYVASSNISVDYFGFTSGNILPTYSYEDIFSGENVTLPSLISQPFEMATSLPSPLRAMSPKRRPNSPGKITGGSPFFSLPPSTPVSSQGGEETIAPFVVDIGSPPAPVVYTGSTEALV